MNHAGAARTAAPHFLSSTQGERRPAARPPPTEFPKVKREARTLLDHEQCSEAKTMNITTQLKQEGYELEKEFETDDGRAEVWIHPTKARGVLIEWFRLEVEP